MPAWITELTQPERLLTVAFILFILWLIGKSMFKAFPFVASFVDLVQTLVGDKDNPGIGERMTKQGETLTAMGELLSGQVGELEKIRAQVQNSHNTNLRDDVDTVKDAVDDVAKAVKTVTAKLDEHIVIAKRYDSAQDETARKVDLLAAKYTPTE